MKRALILAPDGVANHVTADGATEVALRDVLQYSRFERELNVVADGDAVFEIAAGDAVSRAVHADLLLVDIDRLDDVVIDRAVAPVVVLRTGPNNSLRWLETPGVVACVDFVSFAGWADGAAGGWLYGRRDVAVRVGADVHGDGPFGRFGLVGTDLPGLLWRYLAALADA